MIPAGPEKLQKRLKRPDAPNREKDEAQLHPWRIIFHKLSTNVTLQLNDCTLTLL